MTRWKGHVCAGVQQAASTLIAGLEGKVAAIALANTGLREQKLGDMYHGVPARVVLAADLVTEESASDFYVEDAAY